VAVAAAGKVVDNRAIGAVIARAGVCQRQQMLAHILQFDNVPFDIRHFLQSARFYVRAVPETSEQSPLFLFARSSARLRTINVISSLRPEYPAFFYLYRRRPPASAADILQRPPD